jgi:hypothetical protein
MDVEMGSQTFYKGGDMKKIIHTRNTFWQWQDIMNSNSAFIVGICILLLVVISCAGTIKQIKDVWKMSNTSFEVVDSTGQLAQLNKIAIANGISLVLDKKAKKLNPVLLEFTDKFQGYLLKELGKKGIAAVSGKTDSINAVGLIDPFRITSRNEAKVLTGKKPNNAELTLTLRAWTECQNCEALANSVGADAIWVVWASWFTNEQDMSKIEYRDKEKDWLHVSAELFSVKDGKLLAWTAINRTGVGVGPLVKWSAAYSAIAEGMANNLEKHRSGK